MKTLALLLLLAGTFTAEALTVYTDGHIVTVDARFTITDAMAVDEGRIVALGPEAIRLAGGPGATRIDLQGQTVLPGLIDSHAHPVGAATVEFDHPIPDIEDIPQLLAHIAERARALPEGTLIPISQIFITRLKEQRYPTREELDRVAPRHPVAFRTGPDCMLNSAALKAAGIGHGFQLPKNSAGVVVLDEAGEPTGVIHAWSPKIDAPQSTRKPSADETRELVRRLFADYNSVGLTAVADRDSSASALEVYQALRERGELTVRVRVSHGFNPLGNWRTTELQLDEIIHHPLRKPDPLLQIVGTKIYLDGGMLTGSALMLQPWGVSSIYGITDPLYRGVQRTPSENLARMVRKVSAAGLQFTAQGPVQLLLHSAPGAQAMNGHHSVGDGAVKLLVDTYEQVDRESPVRDSRPCVTHGNFVAPESIAQAARLGVAFDVQPIWFYLDGATLLKQFGRERMSRFQPLRAMTEAGVLIGGGSDHMQKIGSLRSINPYNPWLGMWTAVTRRSRGLDEPLYPEAALTREEAIRLYTSNNARLLFLEKEAGSLEPGKRADFIVLDRDVLTCPLDELRGTQVRETWLEGRRVWAVKP